MYHGIHVYIRDISGYICPDTCMFEYGEEPTFEVINFLSKNLRRFSYTKDFCSLHIHGLYLYNTQGFIANKNL